MSRNATDIAKKDDAVEFTLKYLDLLEKHLHVKLNDAGLAVCIVEWIDAESISSLRHDLSELMRDELELRAREATIDYGSTHIQTVGFGLAPDFDQFVKLGLIYGDRVVLWDVIHSRIFANDQPNQDRKGLLAQIACNLLNLRPTVLRGGLVILAHPIVWSNLASAIDEELRAAGAVQAASLGLSLAFAAIKEGLPLHPYVLLEDGSKPMPASPAGREVDPLFSSESFKFQQCVAKLLRDERVAYMEDVRTEDFFDVMSGHAKLRRALRMHFTSVLSGLSPQQEMRELTDKIDDLFELFEKRNVAVKNYVAEAVDATLKFALASVVVTSLGESLVSNLATCGVPVFCLTTAVRKWVNTPEKLVIIQAFNALNEAAKSTPSMPLYDMEFQLSNYRQGQASLGSIYEEFMALPWTEDRHEYLTSLPLDVAKALLALLTEDDLAIIVNERRFQEDYIGDYLAYLSGIDEAIYWEHLGKTFESSDGLLSYDNDDHIRSMETKDMPLKVWNQLLTSLFSAHACELRSRNYGYPLECLPNVVRFQTEATRDLGEKRLALINLASTLTPDDRAALTDFVASAFDGKAPLWLPSE
ncbi:hypothetical protein [Xanthomonas sp. NCPPB 2632]|uniref:hypothetical protein n=1 Tax=Xanthomonas sp. NCPPB 2632 TaxID=3240912 RepID=UPI0035172A7D